MSENKNEVNKIIDSYNLDEKEGNLLMAINELINGNTMLTQFDKDNKLSNESSVIEYQKNKNNLAQMIISINNNTQSMLQAIDNQKSNENYFKIIQEGLKSVFEKIEIFIEGAKDINESIGLTDKSLDATDKRITAVNKNIQVIQLDTEHLVRQFNKVDTIMEEMENIKNIIKKINTNTMPRRGMN